MYIHPQFVSPQLIRMTCVYTQACAMAIPYFTNQSNLTATRIQPLSDLFNFCVALRLAAVTV